MMSISLITSIYPFPKLTIDKTKTEHEIFSTNFRIVNQEAIKKSMECLSECVKDSHLSALFREKGNEHFKKSNFNVAFEFYYKSIGVAPPDSYEYGLALANRSAALFANKNYQDCLKDIGNVLKAKYPDHKLGKLFIRQTECYLNLKQNHKAINSWANASDYLEKFKNIVEVPSHTEVVKRKIMSIIEKMAISDMETPEVVLPRPELKNGENPKFLNASNTVELKYNVENGRYVVAKVDIEPGDVLFVEEPYSAVRNNEQRIFCTYCSYCLSMCMANIPCVNCPVNFYCSENCRQEAWNKVHKWECYGERKQILSCYFRLLLNILLKASYNNFKIDIDDTSIYGNKDDNFPFVYKLVTNKNKMTNDDITICVKCATIIVIYLKQYTDYFEWLHGLPENANKSLQYLYDFVGGILVKLCMQVSCNETEIVSSTICFKDTPVIDIKFVGYGLYVSSAMLNHSCNPNTLFYFDNTLKVVKAREKISKNTEITIDYCKYRSDNIVKYDAFLLDKYKFTCPCAKCRNPSALRCDESPWLCKKCKGKAYHVNSEIYVQCENPDCKHIFNIRKYKNIEQRIAPSILDACINVKSAAFDVIHKQYKQIYHKDNVKFIGFYMSAYEFYLEHRKVSKCLDVCKCFIQFCEQFPEVNDVKVLSHLRFMVALIMYYTAMKKNQVVIRPNIQDEIKSALDDMKRLLSFYVAPRVILQYEQYINKILNDS